MIRLRHVDVRRPPTEGKLVKKLINDPIAVLWPGIVITVTVLGFNLLGDALRDATDPRLKRGPRVRNTEATS